MAAQPKQQRSSILLVDDEKQALRIGKHLERRGFNCTVTSDPHEVLTLVRNNGFDLILVDINMELMDGVELTRRVKEINPHIPVAAFTAYSHFHPWSAKLNRARNFFVAIIEKPFPVGETAIQNFCRRLDDLVDQGRARSLRDEHRPSPAENPFELSFRSFLALDAEEAQRVRMRAWEMKQEWFLQQVEEKNLNWVVVCGDSIVRTSLEGGPVPARGELVAYGEECDRIPFLFVRPPIVEESAWVKTGMKQLSSGADDYYPTIKCTVEYDGHSQNLIGDFDTGAFVTCIDSNIVPIDPFYDDVMKSMHLNLEYKYAFKQIKILLNDENGKAYSAFLHVYVIKDWWGKDSPFIQINPSRRMLVGRDVLQAFDLRFTLDVTKRKTFIEP